MPDSSDRLVKLFENLYAAVFERQQAKSNTVISRAYIVQEDMEPETDAAPVTEEPVTARWYESLTIGGTDTEADSSKYKPSLGTGRVRYRSGVINATTMTQVFRVEMNWSSGSPPIVNPTLFYKFVDANNYIKLDWNAGTWRLQRKSGGAGTNCTVADSFSSGAKRTIGMKLTATQIGISIDGGPFTMVGNTNIPVLGATSLFFDLLTDGT